MRGAPRWCVVLDAGEGKGVGRGGGTPAARPQRIPFLPRTEARAGSPERSGAHTGTLVPGASIALLP